MFARHSAFVIPATVTFFLLDSLFSGWLVDSPRWQQVSLAISCCTLALNIYDKVCLLSQSVCVCVCVFSL